MDCSSMIGRRRIYMYVRRVNKITETVTFAQWHNNIIGNGYELNNNRDTTDWKLKRNGSASLKVQAPLQNTKIIGKAALIQLAK